MSEWVIVVVDTSAKTFPAARKLADLGVSPRTITRWQKVRRDMTSGLRRRVQETKN